MHWPAFRAFLAVCTQWRVVAGMKGIFYQGLDYGGVGESLDRSGIALTARQWADLQDIEVGARDALNERLRR